MSKWEKVLAYAGTALMSAAIAVLGQWYGEKSMEAEISEKIDESLNKKLIEISRTEDKA